MPLHPEQIAENPKFIGRSFEQAELRKIAGLNEANTVVVYGRRRVGKTELLEQTFRDRNILKFEGIENENEEQQRAFVMRQLSHYANEPLLRQLKTENWLDVFDVIYRYTKKGTWTIYFEELQWLANYKDNFVNQLKVAWDNSFRRNPDIIVVLCGSSPSFMVKQVLHSKSFYNRSQNEIHLREFSIQETKEFLHNKSNREVMNAYLTLGGIPEYLKRIKRYSSIFVGICEQSFLPNSYFSQEYQRIFVSSMASNPHYQSIIDYLSQKRFATREQIAKHLNILAGGRLSTILAELELCGFIKKYSPYNLAKNSKLARFRISDAYLQWFFKFIYPELDAIENGHYQSQPTSAIKMENYQKWLGYSFERYCRSNHHVIAKILGFSGVKYKAGTFYNRASIEGSANYQIDLLFERDDQVITVCEIKYLQSKIGTSVIESFEKKLARFDNKKNKTIHKVLISAEGIDDALEKRHYFDAVITLDDLISD